MKKCFFINEEVLLTYYMVLHWPTFFAPFQKIPGRSDKTVAVLQIR